MNSGWQIKFTGWPWWLVLPLAAVGAWALLRVHRDELATLRLVPRRWLVLLRSAALALLILLLLEPTLARKTQERVLPIVAVLVDQSGSMAVKDELMGPGPKLAEAIGLGLLPANARPLKTNATEQAASDQAVVSAAKDGSPVAQALATLGGMSRYERAIQLTQNKVVPQLQDKVRLKLFAMDTGIVPLELTKPAKLLPNRGTDYEASLASVGRLWAQDYVGGVVLVSDGRQSTGIDPAAVIRSLKARGALITGIMVGDPETPPDAVVAEVSGPSEVFLGENVPMSVRFRITGADQMNWDMVITHGGQELERRSVQGNGQWEYENFAFAATNVGINLYQARLELSQDQDADAQFKPDGWVELELWDNVPGESVAEFQNSPAFKQTPSSTGRIEQLDYVNNSANYGARARGFLVPPQSGNYTFWIASDDGSELWLSPSEKPGDKVKVAYVKGYVQRGTWEGQASQKSQPVTLRKGRPCYFEIRHKQGGGEGFAQVGWQWPDGTVEKPIPGARISSYDEQAVARANERRKQAQAKRKDFKEASLANNVAELPVAVNQDPIKVLLVDSTPRWESRYLATMFERDRRVNFTRRYHSVIIDDPNLPLLPKNQAQWDAYDMVCLGDLDTNELPPEQQKYLASFVARRGGFLVCLAGPRGLPKAFSLGALANVLPVRVSLQSNREQEPVTVALTAEGAEHPIMQILNDPGYNQKLWPLLPPLQWVADSVVAKPGATVLLTAQVPAKTPIVALQRYGAGRVFWMGTEESWRWRDRVGERVHQTFWLQAMRWGLAGRLRGKDPQLQVGLDRYLVAPGEAAELKARVSTKDGEVIKESPTVELERIGANGEVMAESVKTLEMTPMADAPEIWQLSLNELEEGTWRITTTHRHPALKGLSETRDLIVRNQTGQEGLELGGDLANLTRMAAIGGHLAGTMDQADSILMDLGSKLKPQNREHRETLSLWNGYFSMLLVMALLCTEWVLRKRQGLP